MGSWLKIFRWFTGLAGIKFSGIKRYALSRHTFISALIFIFISANVFSQEIDISSSIDWMDSSVTIDLSSPLPGDSMNPTHRYQTEQYIQSRAANLITKELGQITIDSNNRLEDLLFRDPLFYTNVENSLSQWKEEFAKSSEDMTEFILRYRIGFYPLLINLFEEQNTYPSQAPPDFFSPLDYRRESFTGILILAQGYLPIHGEEDEGQLIPALFPKIRDPHLNIIYERSMVENEVLVQGGMVLYSNSLAPFSDEWRERIGTKPLHVSARALYGIHLTDIVLSQEDSRLILANEETNSLLSQGKVLVLISLDQ